MTDLEIRSVIAGYIADELTAAELEDQLEGAAWIISEEPSRTLVATALRLLAEHGNGDWSDADLKEALGSLNRLYWFETAPKVHFSDAASTITRLGPPLAAFDRSLAAGCV